MRGPGVQGYKLPHLRVHQEYRQTIPREVGSASKAGACGKHKTVPRHEPQSRPDDTSRSSGDARGDIEPVGGGAWRELWVAGGWNDGTGSASWEERVWVPSAAPSSSWTGADQADRRQTQSSGEWQDWRGSNDWGGWAEPSG